MTPTSSAISIAAGPLDLLAATADQMAALMASPAGFTERYGLAVAAGFLEPAEAATILGVCREALLLDPARLLWWSRLAILRDERLLVGFGGYKGLPRDGLVEIGYQIAPAWRGRGLATAMARGLVTHAWRTPRVTAEDVRGGVCRGRGVGDHGKRLHAHPRRPRLPPPRRVARRPLPRQPLLALAT